MVAFFRNFSQIPANCRNLDAVVLPVETDFSKISLPNEIRVLADIPRGVMHLGDKVKAQLREAMKNGVKAAVAGNLAALTLCNEVGIPVVAGFGLNTFNSLSLEALDKLDIKAAVCSFELTAEGIKNLRSPIPVGAITYGRLPLMIFRNCPGKNGDGCKNCGGKATLCDRKNIEFPVMCRGEFSEMFNSRVLWNFDRIHDISPDFQVLFFTDEEPSRCREIIDAATTMSAPDCEYTRGLYYRGVQ